MSQTCYKIHLKKSDGLLMNAISNSNKLQNPDLLKISLNIHDEF